MYARTCFVVHKLGPVNEQCPKEFHTRILASPLTSSASRKGHTGSYLRYTMRTGFDELRAEGSPVYYHFGRTLHRVHYVHPGWNVAQMGPALVTSRTRSSKTHGCGDERSERGLVPDLNCTDCVDDDGEGAEREARGVEELRAEQPAGEQH
ncbi:hypothetical protein GSI_03901 [Ganoderma sinense ZZ0214-1]|uniref:Uncharacterized protein n=1 Tax=Ganoderma sinense ZZ0214-1 TaxID=1077348 RepID=A0A2G8SKA9_9APHY|nr:hypothetical protein GSI_03901 [Ganoderma sinense ZZ0214-1]